MENREQNFNDPLSALCFTWFSMPKETLPPGAVRGVVVVGEDGDMRPAAQGGVKHQRKQPGLYH